MSRAIIAAIRQQRQLRTMTRTIAIEIAHRMSSSGVGRIAYSFLADKAACSVRTAIRHVQRLVELGLFRKRHTHTPEGYGWNVYEYIGPRLARAPSPATARYDWLAEKHQPSERGEAKVRSLVDEIRDLERGMRLLTPGSVPYASCLERLQALRAMQMPPG